MGRQKYDLAIVIPSLKRKENIERVSKIKRLVNLYKPKNLSYKVHVEYEGSDWSEAINISIKKLIGKVNKGIIFMDDDAFPTSNWMDGFEDYINRLKSAVLQFRLVDSNGYFEVPKLMKLGIIPKLFVKWKAKGSYDYFQLNIPKHFKKGGKEIIGVMLACTSAVYYPKEVIKAVGYFEQDKNLIYGEDSDYALRAIEKGFEIYQLPNMVIHHKKLTKGKKSKEYLDKENYSKIYFHRKWNKARYKNIAKIAEARGILYRGSSAIFLFLNRLRKLEIKLRMVLRKGSFNIMEEVERHNND